MRQRAGKLADRPVPPPAERQPATATCRICSDRLSIIYVNSRRACIHCVEAAKVNGHRRQDDQDDRHRRASVDDAEVAARFDRVKKSLTPGQREILALYYDLPGLTQQQVVERLKAAGRRVSQQGVAAAIGRIRKRFLKAGIALEKHPREHVAW